MVKTFLIGLLTGVATIIINLILTPLFNLIDPNLVAVYGNSALFRIESDPLKPLFYIFPFLLGIILAWVWIKVKPAFKEQAAWKQGVYFGLIIWLISVPDIIINFSQFPLPFLMIISWSVMGGVEAIVAGLIFAKLLK